MADRPFETANGTASGGIGDRVIESYKGLKSSSLALFDGTARPAFRQLENEVGTWTTWYEVPLERRVQLLRHGYLSRARELYDIDDPGTSPYLSYRENLEMRDVNAPWCEILDNKLVFHRELAAFREHLPAVYGIAQSGRFTPVDVEPDLELDAESDAESDDGSDGETTAGEWVVRRVAAGEPLVLKPVRGSTGRDVYVLEPGDDGLLVNGEEISCEAAVDAVDEIEDYVVSEYVRQCDWLDEIYPDAVNTMRVLTMWDADADAPFVARAILRIGTDRSRPVDNFSKGGLSAPIDVDTGEVGRGARLTAGELVRHERHPDTGARIAGRTVDEWETVRELLLSVTESIAVSEYVGWDVTIAADGTPRILEGNNNSDVDLLQVHGPLLADDRVRAFYERHGVV